MSSNKNYVHFVDHKITYCGMYYTVIFPVIGYYILIYVANIFVFFLAIKKFATNGEIKIVLNCDDNKYGLGALHGIFYDSIIIFTLLGFYFIVLFLNWASFNNVKQLFLNAEALIIIIGYLISLTALVWFCVSCINNIIYDNKKKFLSRYYSATQLSNIDPDQLDSLLEKYKTIQNNGTLILKSELEKIKSFYSFSLIANMYLLVIVPIILPFIVGVLVEVFKLKYLHG